MDYGIKKLHDKLGLFNGIFHLQRPILIQKSQEDSASTNGTDITVYIRTAGPIHTINITGDITESITYTQDENETQVDLVYNVMPTNSEVIFNPDFTVTVETYEETTYTKSYPENDEPMGNSYDHDNFIDKLGNFLNIPRRIYSEYSLMDAEQAEPPYFGKNIIDGGVSVCTEDDYYYLERLLFFVNHFHENHLPELMLHITYGISYERMRYYNTNARLCHMDVDYMDEKYMQNSFWDGTGYAYFIPRSTPCNIALPSLGELEKKMMDYIPLTRALQIEQERNTVLSVAGANRSGEEVHLYVTLIDEFGNRVEQAPLTAFIAYYDSNMIPVMADAEPTSLITDVNGEAVFEHTALLAGHHLLVASFEGDDMYLSSSLVAEITVDEYIGTEFDDDTVTSATVDNVDASISLIDQEVIHMDVMGVETVTSEGGYGLKNANVSYIIKQGGSTLKHGTLTTDNTGVIDFNNNNIFTDTPGEIVLELTFAGGWYYSTRALWWQYEFRPCFGSMSLYVAPYPTWSNSLLDDVALTANCKFGLTDPIKHTPVRFGTIKLYASDKIDITRGELLIGEEIPDNNGFVNFDLSGLGGSTYTLRAVFSGSIEGAPSEHIENNVVLSKIGTTIESEITRAVEGDTNIKLGVRRNDTYNLMTNKTVYINVFDRPNHVIKTYTGLTNGEQNGYCFFHITDLPEGTYGVIYTYEGDNYYERKQTEYASLVVTSATTIIAYGKDTNTAWASSMWSTNGGISDGYLWVDYTSNPAIFKEYKFQNDFTLDINLRRNCIGGAGQMGFTTSNSSLANARNLLSGRTLDSMIPTANTTVPVHITRVGTQYTIQYGAITDTFQGDSNDVYFYLKKDGNCSVAIENMTITIRN